jgi:hypothetical protein
VRDEVVKFKVLALTGDLPALKIALNFIGHNGYHCCFFCYLHGVHREGKRQYPYECPFEMRTVNGFYQDAATASRLNRKEKGHLGVSIFSNLVDVQLPYSIIIDYAHASLLRHSKSIFSELYRRLSPAVRIEVDTALTNQNFPHFFHRHMKSFKDLSFIKATEIRNILFYGFIPIFHQRLPMNLFSHFTLYISGMRLLHGRPIFGNQTQLLGHNLLINYYRDFPLFYQGLENLVLHLHSHYGDQYRMYGAFSHLGSFGQEGLIGYIGTNRSGTRYHGDIICNNYSIDLILNHEIKDRNSFTKTVDGPFDENSDFDFTLNDIFIHVHHAECNCTSINICLKAFRRCVIQQQVYHSMLVISYVIVIRMMLRSIYLGQ